MNVREAIMDANRLARMRMGQAAWEYIEFSSLHKRNEKGEVVEVVRLAQVPLLEAEVQAGMLAAAKAFEADEVTTENTATLTMRDRAAQVSDVWHSLRVPGDLERKAFESIEEMVETLSSIEIDMAVDNLAEMMDYSSPRIDGISEEVLDDLKVAFAQMNLSELSGRRWAAVKRLCSVLLPELLQVRSSGSTSTDS